MGPYDGQKGTITEQVKGKWRVQLNESTLGKDTARFSAKYLQSDKQGKLKSLEGFCVGDRVHTNAKIPTKYYKKAGNVRPIGSTAIVTKLILPKESDGEH